HALASHPLTMAERQNGKLDVTLPPLRQPLKRIDDAHVHRHEVARVARENCQVVVARGCGDGNVGETRSMAAAAGEVRQRSGNLRGRAVEGQYTAAVEMQDGAQPA